MADENNDSTPVAPTPLTEDQISKVVNRRHPYYDAYVTHWDFLEETYKGRRSWFDDNIFKYLKEGDGEFQDRIQRAYRFNHSKEICDLVNKYLFKPEIARKKDTDLPDWLEEFWDTATLSGLSIEEYMKILSLKSSIFGRIWIVVDNTRVDADYSDVSPEKLTVEQEKELGIRTYSYMVRPQDVVDLSYDETMNLNWILIREFYRDDNNPVDSDGSILERYRLWTRDAWYLLQENKDQATSAVNVQNAQNISNRVTSGTTAGTIKTKGDKKFTEVDSGFHNLGVVPVIRLDHNFTEDPYTAPALINDIAYLDRAVANYLSNLDAIIQDQTFSQLAIPAQGIISTYVNAESEDEKSAYTKILEMGTKRIFTYDDENGSQPFFLSPDVKQAELIIFVVKQVINEIYHSVGVAGERTKQDNALGIDNSSGVAKAYDFERVNALLRAKAETLQECEERIIKLVALWNQQSEVEAKKERYVTYPDNFDTRDIYNELDLANRFAMIPAPDLMRKEQMKMVIEKVFPNLSKDLIEKMKKEIDDKWPVDFEMSLGGSNTSMEDILTKGESDDESDSESE